MSTVELHGQAVRQAWVQKGRARERDSSATGVKVVELVSIAVLITAAALWPVVAPFDLVTRFVVALGAVVMRVPSVTGLDQDPLTVIETGDWVKVDGDRGIVQVTKKA